VAAEGISLDRCRIFYIRLESIGLVYGNEYDKVNVDGPTSKSFETRNAPDVLMLVSLALSEKLSLLTRKGFMASDTAAKEHARLPLPSV